jgi:hypothetical protein
MSWTAVGVAVGTGFQSCRFMPSLRGAEVNRSLWPAREGAAANGLERLQLRCVGRLNGLKHDS